MTAMLSSPAWADEGHALSPPSALPDGSLVQDLDRSFGSSMSISSLDSPAHVRTRHVAAFTALDVLAEDPFAPAWPKGAGRGDRDAARMSPRMASFARSSPHAMEISSPAVDLPRVPGPSSAAAPERPAGACVARVSLVRTREMCTRSGAEPCARAAAPPQPAHLTVPRAAVPHRLSVSQLSNVEEVATQVPASSPGSPLKEPPLKRRVSSLRQVQETSTSTTSRRVVFSQHVARMMPPPSSGAVRHAHVRTHVRSQSTSMWWPATHGAFPAHGASPSHAPHTSADDSFGSTGGAWLASDASGAGGAPADVSPRSMGDYFFDPQSPQVPQAAGGVSARSQAPSVLISPSSTPCSSPCHRAQDGGAPAPGRGPCADAFTQTVPCDADTPAFLAADTSVDVSTDDADVSMLEGRSVLHGSPVRISTRRQNRTLALPPRRTQTVVEAPIADKENEMPAVRPSPGLPGFGTFEMDRKALPCFPVKSDGLMRVSPDTVQALVRGMYTDRIRGYRIVDCRFAYEHEGGHIAGAVNLNTVAQVHEHFLSPGCGLHAGQPLPCRTQSGLPDENGDTRKFVVIFHCEFSCKRAPSLALALRQGDRSLANDYPQCHFPDVYVMQGGYASFFQTCPQLCEPRAYVRMDDPRFLQARSSELSGFRRQFSRNRSFAYGEAFAQELNAVFDMRRVARSAPALEPAPCVGERRTSVLPSAPVATLALDNRQVTSSTLVDDADAAAAHPSPCVLSASLAPPETRDTSFSSNGDSSFEADASDSPSAAAGTRRPSLAVHALTRGVRGGSMPFATRVLRRSETTPMPSRG
ncbi:protein-tyrosine-phosphatase [Malassezia sp. CBS 17886]|nr:protein-tyrosine-phosphatase [Malassezia sp. CBS 17886]